MSDEPICEAIHSIQVNEYDTLTYSCELPAGHEGLHWAKDQNGSGEVTWSSEP